MRLIFAITALAIVAVSIGLSSRPAAAQSFDERWSVAPKPPSDTIPDMPAPRMPDSLPSQPPPSHEQPSNAADTPFTRSFNQAFSGKASYYSYSKGKTASGAPFDPNQYTAAHRSLPFGTRVRVIDVATQKSVVVRVTDRGPWIRDRVLDLSLAAARSLGITDRGVVQVRVEVL